MPFSARKMHFFEKNCNLTPCPAQPSSNVKKLFFREVILHQFLKRKNSSLTSTLSLTEQGVKLPFLSKKCIFRAEKGIFSKSSFYTKMFSDRKYSFSVCQKRIFVIQSKVNIFHQIQPSHNRIFNCKERLFHTGFVL